VQSRTAVVNATQKNGKNVSRGKLRWARHAAYSKGKGNSAQAALTKGWVMRLMFPA
jgi:hypothetical protein